MEVLCESCQGKFKIPDEKLPKGQVLAFSCPRCKSKITVDTRSPREEAAGRPVGGEERKSLIEEVSSGSYNAAEKPFDFIEEGAKTALLCESDPELRAKDWAAMENMGYLIMEAGTALEALKKMRFHVFDLILLNERFDCPEPGANNVLHYLEQLNMGVRRNIFVALVSSRFRTMDNMAAFNQSVNLVVHPRNIEDIEKILRKGIADNTAFYRVMKESLTRLGKH